MPPRDQNDTESNPPASASSTALALAVALREHELRVEREQVGGLGVELAPHARELIRDVHVGPLHEPLEHGPARVGVVTSSAMPRLLRFAISKR